MSEREDRPTGSDQDPLSCEQFQEQMPELMGGNIHDHEHLRTCHRCNALLADLEEIGRAAKAFLNKEQDPADDIWEKIRTRIGDDEITAGKHSRA